MVVTSPQTRVASAGPQRAVDPYGDAPSAEPPIEAWQQESWKRAAVTFSLISNLNVTWLEFWA